MAVRPITLGLGLALIVSLIGNAYLLVALLDAGHGWSDQMSVSRHLRDERAALRNLTLRIANGETHRSAFDAVLRDSGGDGPYDEEGWWGEYPLVARFDGDRLTDVCWTVTYSNEDGPCSTEVLEGRESSAPSP